MLRPRTAYAGKAWRVAVLSLPARELPSEGPESEATPTPMAPGSTGGSTGIRSLMSVGGPQSPPMWRWARPRPLLFIPCLSGAWPELASEHIPHLRAPTPAGAS